MVEQSIRSAPLAAVSKIPPSSMYNERTSGPAGTIEKITFAPSTASLSDPAASAPASLQAAIADADLS